MNTDMVPSSPGDFLMYETTDGETKIEVRMEDETVWLSQRDIAELFQTTPQNITIHIKALYEEGELPEEATCKDYLQVRSEGNREVRRFVKHYNLEVIISVGYRVKSLRAIQFRIWATHLLREYMIKGFTMDDDRLKRGGGGRYFDELLNRIRDIRSSERVFWKKVLEIYATSIDYDARSEVSRRFFQTIQNKMHWAIHGHTAAEIIHQRADASKPKMGLTSWAGDKPRKSDVVVAKNYLNEDEIKSLNLMVSAYLDFAELQALNRKPMTMKDWIVKLDDFLRAADRELLHDKGKVSHDKAVAKASEELEKYRKAQSALPQPVDRHFDEAVKKAKQFEKKQPPETGQSPRNKK